MAEILPYTADTIFTSSYVFNYERLSASPTRPYESNARVLASLSDVKSGEVVLEVGCGTGNSTIVFAESMPQIGRLVGVEPSPPFLELAKFKFGKTKGSLPTDLDADVKGFIEGQRERAKPFSGKVDFVHARADGYLPIRDESVSTIFAASVLHWLAFDNSEFRDRNYLDNGISDFARVLKPGGKLIFDSSGLQFDFGDDKLAGRPVNSYHWLNHSFHMKFLEKIADDFRDRDLPIGQLNDFSSLDRMYHIFDLNFLRTRLASFGFEQIPVSGERPYHLQIDPLSFQTIMDRVTGGSRMRYFNSPGLRQLPDETKDRIISRAYERAVGDYDPQTAEDGAEIMASFLFSKKQ